MNIDELISTLTEIKQFANGRNLHVVIPVFRNGSIGETPCVDIDSVYRDADWNSNKVFICPEDKLEVLSK